MLKKKTKVFGKILQAPMNGQKGDRGEPGQSILVGEVGDDGVKGSKGDHGEPG